VDRFGVIRSQKEFIQALKRPLLTWADFERVQQAHLAHVGRSAPGLPHHDGPVRQPAPGQRHGGGATANFAGMFNLEQDAGRFFSARRTTPPPRWR